MKRPALLFCLALITGPLVATGWAACASAEARGFYPDDPHNNRHQKHDDRDGRFNDRNGRDDSQGPAVPPFARTAPPDNRPEGRDDRINRAISVGQSRGRVLDAGSQGGSVFWVRVDTGHGRVDLLVDAASGRIVGEK